MTGPAAQVRPVAHNKTSLNHKMRLARDWAGHHLFDQHLSLSWLGWIVMMLLALALALGTYGGLQRIAQARLLRIAETVDLAQAFCSGMPALNQNDCAAKPQDQATLAPFSDEVIWSMLIDAGVIGPDTVATPADLVTQAGSDEALANTYNVLKDSKRRRELGPNLLIAFSRGVCNNDTPRDVDKDRVDLADAAYAPAVAYFVTRLYPSDYADASALRNSAFMANAAAGEFDLSVLRMSVPNSVTDSEIANAMLLKSQATDGTGYRYGKNRCGSQPMGANNAPLSEQDIWRSFDQMEKLLTWGIGQMRTTGEYRSGVFYVTLITGWEQFLIFLVGYFALVLCLGRLSAAAIMMKISQRMIRTGAEVDPGRDNVVRLLARAGAQVRSLDPGERAYWKDQLMDEIASARWPMRFAVATLPALGFIGTVRGIMNSLTGADSIVWATTASERAQAISTLSADLGLAFATTLLALAFGILLSLLAALEVRYFEQSILPLFGRYAFDTDDSGNEEAETKRDGVKGSQPSPAGPAHLPRPA
ncbi:MotA/TolQ/ExbB proton channel family protein [Mesorhizobium sp. M0520]|uniref:MotA/TolQ/ExbB proton channel family protein n=1 Tax=Mesorhizobium sp. M0520 TaxID=2956957 RepID=UPI003337A0A7